MLGNHFNFFKTEPIKEMTEDDLKSLEERNARGERIRKALDDFKDNSKEKISLILKEWEINSEDELLIDNLHEPKKIVDIVTAEIDGKNHLDFESRRGKFGRAMLREQAVKYKAKDVDRLAKGVDLLIHRFSGRSQFPRILMPGEKEDKDYVPNSPEGDELRKLANSLKESARSIYNFRPVLTDADEAASAITYFTERRINDFLLTLPDDQSRYSYLIKIESAFLGKNSDADILDRFNNKVFHSSKDFHIYIRRMITTYEKLATQKNPNFGFSYKEEVMGNFDGHTQETQEKGVQGRDEKRVFLALEVILRKMGSKGTKTDNGKMMAFLSGFSAESMRQNYTKSAQWKEKEEALNHIRQLAIDYKIPSLKKWIEEEIKELRGNRNR